MFTENRWCEGDDNCSFGLESTYDKGLEIDDDEFDEETEDVDMCLVYIGVDFLFSCFTLIGDISPPPSDFLVCNSCEDSFRNNSINLSTEFKSSSNCKNFENCFQIIDSLSKFSNSKTDYQISHSSKSFFPRVVKLILIQPLDHIRYLPFIRSIDQRRLCVHCVSHKSFVLTYLF